MEKLKINGKVFTAVDSQQKYYEGFIKKDEVYEFYDDVRKMCYKSLYELNPDVYGSNGSFKIGNGYYTISSPVVNWKETEKVNIEIRRFKTEPPIPIVELMISTFLGEDVYFLKNGTDWENEVTANKHKSVFIGLWYGAPIDRTIMVVVTEYVNGKKIEDSASMEYKDDDTVITIVEDLKKILGQLNPLVSSIRNKKLKDLNI
jgi:hypothetical protein